MNKEELQAAVDAVPYWYHRIALPNGIVTPGWAPINPAAYKIPDDLTGKTVLDVGAWDGYWTFEALKRGAKLVDSVDDFSDTVGAVTKADRSKKWETLKVCASALGYGIESFPKEAGVKIRLTECNIEQACSDEDFLGSFESFDAIFCFGTLYHLKNPLIVLDGLHGRLNDNGTIHIETAILDGCKSAYGNYGYRGEECCFEFYPHDEYGMNDSNWWVGTLKAWCSLVEAAGFKNIESWKLTDNPKSVAEARGFIRASAC